MKRFASLLLTAVLIMNLCSLGVLAAETQDVIYLEDGSYIVVTVETSVSKARTVKTQNKYYHCYGSDDELEWEFDLTASFTYDGISASCTKSDCSLTIYEDAWYEISKVATHSGATARATLTIGKKALGVTILEKTYNLSLTCTPDGNVY